MRLWSLHPCYLDSKGLVALWREGLLARAILNTQTQAYKHHPQLDRFKGCSTPASTINRYLWFVYDEAMRRGYHFDKGKLGPRIECPQIPVTQGQLNYELAHLQTKLKLRDAAKYREISSISQPTPHPSFRVVPGDIEPWEKVR